VSSGFDLVLGVGGIGSGVLWQLEENRILDRDESRAAKLSKARDYCKQHIILHYLARVLDRDADVYAIGKTGDDDAGRVLRNEMREAGIKLDFVEEVAGGITMRSVCIQYPDFHVCNLTASNSVAEDVDAVYVQKSLERLRKAVNSRAVMVAAPEAPLDARIELLEYGKRNSAFCVTSVLCDEAKDFLDRNGLALCDLLVINETEARAFLDEDLEFEELVHAFACLPEMGGRRAAITFGERGSFTVENGEAVYTPAFAAKAASTAGAGDAFTAGLICGLHFGLPFHSARKEVFSAASLAAAFAAKSVECIHTISPDIDRNFANGIINAL